MFKSAVRFALVLALGIASASPAAFAAVTKNARANDVASQYILEDNGDLFRIIRRNGAKCQVTNRVDNFKVSQHPNDAAMIYFERDRDLYILNNTDTAAWGSNCPAATKKVIVENVKKYSVVPSTETTIVNVALTQNGEFTAWDNNYVRVKESGVRSYVMNQNYGVSGKPFSTYVLFALDRSGYVLKVKGKSPSESKWDNSRRYSDINEFLTINRIQQAE